MIKFTRGNAKLDKLERRVKGQVWTFSVLSGHTCPYAKDCQSKAIPMGEKLGVIDGPHTQFRCFSASQEAFYRNLYNHRRDNMVIIEEAAKSIENAASLIIASIPAKAKVIRLHVGGDFKTQAYFDAWLLVAKSRPDIVFYAYTKSLPFWVKRLGEIPTNFVLTASYGGYKDELISQHNLRYAKVVYSEAEARKLKLPIDHDDSHAVKPTGNFALLIHGIQPKGSEAAKAKRKLKGKGSYHRNSAKSGVKK